MWDIDFHGIEWREGILAYDGDPLEPYYCVNPFGELMVGLKCLEYFATYGCPYEDIVLLYGILRETSYIELDRKLKGKFEEPMFLVKEILGRNIKDDRKKKK